jgi:hypothetical protein
MGREKQAMRHTPCNPVLPVIALVTINFASVPMAPWAPLICTVPNTPMLTG